MKKITTMKELLNERLSEEDIIKLVSNYDNKFSELEKENKRKDKEIGRLNNIIKKLEEFIEREIELYTIELTEENERKLSIVAPIKGVYKEIYNVLQELKGSDSNE